MKCIPETSSVFRRRIDLTVCVVQSTRKSARGFKRLCDNSYASTPGPLMRHVFFSMRCSGSVGFCIYLRAQYLSGKSIKREAEQRPKLVVLSPLMFGAFPAGPDSSRQKLSSASLKPAA